MNNYNELMVYALRYSLGRLSYAPSTVRKELKANIDKIDNNTLNVMIRDVKEWVERDICSYYNVEKDEQEQWSNFLQWLENESDARTLNRKKAVVFDIDGTISDASERLHYIHSKPKNFVAFHSECVNDAPIETTLKLLRFYHDNGYKVILLTRRPKFYRIQSEEWLEKNGVPYDNLIMCEDTYTSAIDYKREEIRSLKQFYDIEAVFEDQVNIASMFREEGLFVFDVGGVEIKR